MNVKKAVSGGGPGRMSPSLVLSFWDINTLAYAGGMPFRWDFFGHYQNIELPRNIAWFCPWCNYIIIVVCRRLCSHARRNAPQKGCILPVPGQHCPG